MDTNNFVSNPRLDEDTFLVNRPLYWALLSEFWESRWFTYSWAIQNPTILRLFPLFLRQRNGDKEDEMCT